MTGVNMKKTADIAIRDINARMAAHSGDSRTVADDDVRMCAMACRIQELEEGITLFKNEGTTKNMLALFELI